MLELLECLAVHLVELGGAALEHCSLGLECLPGGIELIACAGVLALHLVELYLALLLAGLDGLCLLHTLVGLLLCLGGDAQSLLAALELLVAADVSALALCIGDNLLGACGGHASLHDHRDGDSDSARDHADRYI